MNRDRIACFLYGVTFGAAGVGLAGHIDPLAAIGPLLVAVVIDAKRGQD